MIAINWEQALLWVATGFLGAMVGTAELVSRYRDAPSSALRTLAAWLYIAINTAASLGAYKFALTMGWSFLPQGSKGQPAADWSLAIVCGLSAMALFRSSLFIRRIGDKDIGVGPSSFLQVFLNAADSEVDRERAVLRAAAVSQITKGIDYRKAFVALPPYCLALMQNLSDEDQRALRKSLELLDKDPMPDDLKVAVLGLELVNVVGVAVVEQAIESLRDRIT